MNNSPLIAKYGDEEVRILALRKSRYIETGRIAITAIAVWPDGEQEETKVSVNLNEGQPILSKDLPMGQFAARADAEYEPIFNSLMKAGWLKQIGEAPSGYVTCAICKLTDKAILA